MASLDEPATSTLPTLITFTLQYYHAGYVTVVYQWLPKVTLHPPFIILQYFHVREVTVVAQWLGKLNLLPPITLQHYHV